jgi:aspartokinase
VSVVGDGLTAGTGVLGGVVEVLERTEAEVRAVHAGALRVGATIRAAKLKEAQRALHAAFAGVR